MERVATTEQAKDQKRSTVQPYAPSWVDRFTDWVRRLPIPAWLFYAALAVGISLLYAAIKWSDGTYPIDRGPLFLILSASTLIYGLALMHYLDNWAGVALARFRPVLTLDEAGYNKLHYQLTTLPSRPTLVATIIGALYGLSGLLSLSPEDVAEFGLFTSPLASVIEVLALATGYISAAILIYHTVRQLRMVSRIYTNHTRIDLFQLGPLYSFSKLAARTAIGIGIPSYAWATINADPGAGVGSLAETGVFTVIVVATFVWPLLGAHRLLQEEKERLKSEAAQRLKAVMAELNSRADRRDFSEVEGINLTIDGILKQQSVIDKISTWPWQPETLRGLGAAILLPLVVWGIQRLLENLGF
jgi:hypothetical protein